MRSHRCGGFHPPKEAPATRPFTRTLNVFYDAIKPKLYNKVDRSVLDALVRQLEGYHQTSVALTIPELAAAAGVSPWSTTQALARLVKADIIVRWRKKMKKTGRYIWVLALSEIYRVVQGVNAIVSEAANLVPAPRSPSPEKRPAPEPPPQQLTLTIPEPPRIAEPTPWREPLLEDSEPVAPEPQPPELDRSEPPAESPRKTSRPPLTESQRESLNQLRELKIDYWMANKLVRNHSLELIGQVVNNMRVRPGIIRNPAAWIVRELERGGYDTPPAIRDAQLRQAKLVHVERQREVEQRQVEAAEEATQHLLQSFRELSVERQRELEHLVRQELRRVSPRLADAPLELDNPGPLRSKLLELLESADAAEPPPGELPPPAPNLPRCAGFTPRRGRGHFRRGPATDIERAADSS